MISYTSDSSECYFDSDMHPPLPFTAEGDFLQKGVDFLWHIKYTVVVAQKVGDGLSPRTGRPKSEKPKTIEVKARIDAATNEQLQRYCDATGKTRTDVVREGIAMVLGQKK